MKWKTNTQQNISKAKAGFKKVNKNRRTLRRTYQGKKRQ